jgi:hypothetical protein
MKRHLLAILLAASVVPASLAWSAAASAQQAPPPQAPQQPPSAAGLADEVKLKDGSVFRGTITELVPRDHIDLLLPGGKTRRFAAADVAYAGPAVRPPGPAAPAGPPVPQGVPVHVESDQEDVQLLVRTGQMEGEGWGYRGPIGMIARDYANICTAPCDTQVPAGQHRLALSLHGGHVVEAEDPVEVRGPSTLRATYDSRLVVRVVGYVVTVASLVTGIVLVAESYNGNCNNPNVQHCSQFNTGELVAGIVVGIGGAIVGGVMSGIGDKASFQLVPTGAAGPIKLPGSSSEGAASATIGQAPGAGLALRVRF